MIAPPFPEPLLRAQQIVSSAKTCGAERYECYVCAEDPDCST